jgi:hypothetical protein
VVAATVQLARWLDASSRRPRGCVRLNRQKPQSPSLRSRLNDDRTFRSEKSTYLSRARSQKREARSENRGPGFPFDCHAILPLGFRFIF